MSSAPSCLEGAEAALVARALLSALDEDLGAAPSKTAVEDEALPEVPGVLVTARAGRGGMGSVFRGTLTATGGEVAVKLPHPALVPDPAMAARFHHEAESLRRLDHPHVLRVLDSGVLPDGRAWLVTAWAPGGDLRARLRQGRPDTALALRWFRETCAAVAAAHQAGILHRDLKPANLLLDACDRVLVADFGLARLLSEESHALRLSLTLSTDVFGTPYYIAPEARQSAARLDERADIFSLGVLLHELLTGRVPIGQYTPASKSAPVPRAVDAVIARCLQEEPAARPASVRALIAQLDAALAARKARVIPRAAAFLCASLLAAAVMHWRREPAPDTHAGQTAATPALSAPGRPWQNSLGMKFLPVPGTRVLFSVWETRRRDYETFAAGQPAQPHPLPWQLPGFAVSPEHPVSAVNADDAAAFCAWLTARERALGLLGAEARYRLPTDDEWLAARGGGDSPESGNFAGRESTGPFRPPARPHFQHRDAWPQSAPAGSFPANEHGLHDMAGNVAEWCRADGGRIELNLRGGSWNDGEEAAAAPAHRRAAAAFQFIPGAGFRVVLEAF